MSRRIIAAGIIIFIAAACSLAIFVIFKKNHRPAVKPPFPLRAEITLPADDYLVRADVPVFGTASGTYFSRYVLDYGKGHDPKRWSEISSMEKPVILTEEDLKHAYSVREGSLPGNLGSWITGLTTYKYGKQEQNLEGYYTLRLQVWDQFGRVVEDRVTVNVGEVILNTFGGRSASPDGRLKLEVPEHALGEGALVVSILKAASAPSVPPDYKLLGEIYEFRPPGTAFLEPAMLTMSFKDIALDEEKPRELGLYQFDPQTRAFRYLDTQIDWSRGNATARISKFAEPFAYLALLCCRALPSPPVLEHVQKDFQAERAVNLSGQAMPNTDVALFVNDIFERNVTPDIGGAFVIKNVFMPGVKNKIELFSRDEFGRLSQIAATHEALEEESLPNLTSVVRMDETFRRKDDSVITNGTMVFLQGSGPDPHPDRLDVAAAHVSSESEFQGFTLLLYEIDVSAGIYRASFTIGEKTDPEERTLKVEQHRESILIKTLGTSETKLEFVYSDTTPPRIDEVSSLSHPSPYQNTFEQGLGNVEPMDGDFGAVLEVVSESDEDTNHVLKLTNPAHMGSFATRLYKGSYNAEQFPVLSFRYRMPPKLEMNLLVRAESKWHELILTGKKKGYRRIGLVPLGTQDDIVADNTWHQLTINLANLLESAGSQKNVTEIVLANWAEEGFRNLKFGRNAKGIRYYLDDIWIGSYFREPKQLVLALSEDDDVSEISFCVSRSPNTVCDTVPEAVDPDHIVIESLWSGENYVHLRVADLAGNWSRTEHWKLLTDFVPPHLRIDKKDDRTDNGKIKLTFDDSGGSGIDPRSIRFGLGDQILDVYSDGVHFEEKNETLTIDAERLASSYVTEDDIELIMLRLVDNAGNESEPVKVNLSMNELKMSQSVPPPVVYGLPYYYQDEQRLTLSWAFDPALLYKGVSYILDQNSTTEPDNVLEGPLSEITFPSPDMAGPHMFHIKALSLLGQWSETAHYPISLLKPDAVKDQIDYLKVEPSASRDLLGLFHIEQKLEKRDGKESIAFSMEAKSDTPHVAISYDLGIEEQQIVRFQKDNFDVKVGGFVRFIYKKSEPPPVVRVSLATLEGTTNSILIHDYVRSRVDGWHESDVPIVAFTGEYNRSFISGMQFEFASHDQALKGSWALHEITFLKGHEALVVARFDREDYEGPHWARIWQNSVGGNLFTFSDGLALIEAKHEYEGETQGFYRLDFKGVVTHDDEGATYCGWQCQLPKLDVRGYNALSFRMRAKGDGIQPNVYLLDGQQKVYVDLEKYVSIDENWTNAHLPLSVFQAQGMDLSHLIEIQFVFEWSTMSGDFFLDDLRFDSVNFPVQPFLNRIGFNSGFEPVVTGYAVGADEVEIALWHNGFSEYSTIHKEVDTDGRFVAALPYEGPGLKKFYVRGLSRSREMKSSYSLPQVVTVPLNSTRKMDMLENFDGQDMTHTWWDIDGRQVYERHIVATNSISDNYAMELRYRKKQNLPYSFTAMSLLKDRRFMDLRRIKGLSLETFGLTAELLVKLQDLSGRECTLLKSRTAQEGRDGWSRWSFFVPAGNNQFDFSSVAQIFFFIAPGDTKVAGSFLMDRIKCILE